MSDVFRDFSKTSREISQAIRGLTGVARSANQGGREFGRAVGGVLGFPRGDFEGEGNTYRAETYRNRSGLWRDRSEDQWQSYRNYRDEYPPQTHGRRFGRNDNRRDAYYLGNSDDPYITDSYDPANTLFGMYERSGEGLDDTYLFSSPPPLRATLDAARNLPEIRNYFAAHGQNASDASRRAVLHAWQNLVFEENPGVRSFSPQGLEQTLDKRLRLRPRRYSTGQAAPDVLEIKVPEIETSGDLEQALHTAGFASGRSDGKMRGVELEALETAMNAYNKANPNDRIDKAYEFTTPRHGADASFEVDTRLSRFIARQAAEHLR